MDDHLSVEVPINSYPNKSAFVDAARRTREMTSCVEPFAELGAKGEAVLIYNMALPAGTLRVAEHFTVESGRISRIVHVHDTAALRGMTVDQG